MAEIYANYVAPASTVEVCGDFHITTSTYHRSGGRSFLKSMISIRSCKTSLKYDQYQCWKQKLLYL